MSIALAVMAGIFGFLMIVSAFSGGGSKSSQSAQLSQDYVIAAVRLDEAYKHMLDNCVVEGAPGTQFEGTRGVSDAGCISMMQDMKTKCAGYSADELKYLTACSDSRLRLVR